MDGSRKRKQHETIATSLPDIAENTDVFQRHLLSYLSIGDFVKLRPVSKRFLPPIDDDTCWKILSHRDLGIETNKQAPEYNPHTKSYDKLREFQTYKESYQQWLKWQQLTYNGIEPRHMVQAIDLWSRCKTALKQKGLTKILDSLQPPPNVYEDGSTNGLKSHKFYEMVAANNFPSSFMAFYAIHGGQSELQHSDVDGFFAGLFGSYSCYNLFYSMRLTDIEAPFTGYDNTLTKILIGSNVGNPRTLLLLDYGSNEGPEGSMYLGYYQSDTRHLVCRGGLLSYFETFVERLERNVYQPSTIRFGPKSLLGLCLFPETGDTVSVAVTNGVEVRASARWFPDRRRGGAMNFGYSIRIRLAESDHSDQGEAVSCQLVDRNWEFHYADGTTRRVQGEGVTGKQPILFRRENGDSGFIHMGPAGTGETNLHATFVYQSQSGPVPGTSSEDVTRASNAFVRGTFSFRPGSIDAPTGPLFLVTVADFPLRVTLPFY